MRIVISVVSTADIIPSFTVTKTVSVPDQLLTVFSSIFNPSAVAIKLSSLELTESVNGSFSKSETKALTSTT